jgi:hypothetical protein
MMEESEEKPPLPPAPALSPDLVISYNELSEDNKRLFLVMFRYLWGCVAPARRFTGFGGVLSSFWAVDLLRVRAGVNPSELAILTFIYNKTRQGREFISSKEVYNSLICPEVTYLSLIAIISRIKKSGYIVRSSKDPAHPYQRRTINTRQKIFIKLSPLGVHIIEDMEYKLYRMLVDGCYSDLTGIKKTR